MCSTPTPKDQRQNGRGGKKGDRKRGQEEGLKGHEFRYHNDMMYVVKLYSGTVREVLEHL